MPDYLRHRVPGGTHFLTVNLLERRTDLLTRHIDILRRLVAWGLRRHRFYIYPPDWVGLAMDMAAGDPGCRGYR